MKQGRLGYNSSNNRYGLLASDLWIDTGFHCGEGLEVLVDDKWVRTRIQSLVIISYIRILIYRIKSISLYI